MYDMPFRDYDPAIARWVVVDPVVHYDYSPYNAFDNNPVYWADPSGANSNQWVQDFRGDWHHVLGSDFVNGGYNSSSGQSFGDWYSENIAPYGGEQEYTNEGRGRNGGPGGDGRSFWDWLFGRKKNKSEVIVEEATVIMGTELESTNNTLNLLGLGVEGQDLILSGAVANYIDKSIWKVSGNDLVNSYGKGGARYLKALKIGGVATSVFTTGYSTMNVYNQYEQGGWNEVFNNRDIVDAGVGVVGLGSTALVTLGLISNPVGWGIGIGILAYGIGTYIYDVATEP